MVEGKKKIAVREGLYRIPSSPGDKGYLIASKCKDCGECFHPQREVCLNCYSTNLEEVALSRKGKVWTYTIARQTYPGAPLTTPFIVAQVELPEHVTVMSNITDCALDAVKIGMDVELYFWKVRDDENGNEVIAYAFRPITS